MPLREGFFALSGCRFPQEREKDLSKRNDIISQRPCDYRREGKENSPLNCQNSRHELKLNGNPIYADCGGLEPQ